LGIYGDQTDVEDATQHDVETPVSAIAGFFQSRKKFAQAAVVFDGNRTCHGCNGYLLKPVSPRREAPISISADDSYGRHVLGKNRRDVFVG